MPARSGTWKVSFRERVIGDGRWRPLESAGRALRFSMRSTLRFAMFAAARAGPKAAKRALLTPSRADDGQHLYRANA